MLQLTIYLYYKLWSISDAISFSHIYSYFHFFLNYFIYSLENVFVILELKL